MTTVFLHPVGLDGRSFQFLTSPKLDTAIRYDCIWHGPRPKPHRPLTIESMADDVAANTSGLLDLVGVSMGGHIAQQVAIRHPTRVRSLMITSRAYPTRAERTAQGPPAPGERSKMVMEMGMENVTDWALSRWFTPEALSDPDHAGVAYTRERLLNDTEEQLAAAWAALEMLRTSLEDQVAALTIPTTIVHSTDDHVQVETQQRLAESLPIARLIVCHGPHMIHLEEPRVFEEAVLDHLEWTAMSVGRA